MSIGNGAWPAAARGLSVGAGAGIGVASLRIAARHPWFLASCAVTLLALVLRLHGLAGRSIWWDEGWSVALARMPLAQMAESTAHDVHPPLYYLALGLWRLLAGESEFALRFFSLCFGVLLVPLVYRLGRRLLSPVAGLLAVLLVAVSPFCIAWSQETRMYVVATALGVASTWLATRMWDERRGFWAYLLTSVALLYTLYLGIVFVLVQNLAWLALQVSQGGRSWRRWVAVQVTLALCLAPWLAYALARTRTWSVADPIGLGRLLYYYWAAVVTGTSAYVETHTPLLVALAAGLLVATVWLGWGQWGRGWWRPLLLLAGVLMPPLVVFVMSQPRSFLYSPRPEPRYLNPFAPFVYLPWACGIAVAWRHRRRQALALAAVAVCGLLVSLPSYYGGRSRSDDYESMACTLSTYVRPSDLVLVHTDHDWPVFAYHYAGEWEGVPNAVSWDPASAEDYIQSQTGGRATVWLALTTDAIRADPGMALEQSLRTWCGEGCSVDEWRFGERRLLRLGRGEPLPAPSLAAARPWAGPTGVAGAWWASTDLLLGGEWRAYLWWDGTGEQPELAVTGDAVGTTALPGTPEVSAASTPLRLAYSFVPPSAGGYAVSVRSGGLWPLTRLTVMSPRGQSAATDVGTAHSVGAAFADGVYLDAYAVDSTTVTPGGGLCVVLNWRATESVSEPFAVFVHLLGSVYNADAGNFIWGQHDGQPADGTRPLTGWRLGETIADRHCFVVSAKAPPGTYWLEVGFYDRTSGVRLPLLDGGDSVILGDVLVAAPRS